MLEITWLGHGSFQFRLENGEVFVIDPWIDGNPKYPAGHTFTRVDSILITHGHFDHIQGVQSLAARFSPQILCNYEISLWLASKGIEKCIGMNKGGTAQLGSIRATLTHAMHSSSIVEDGKVIYAGEPGGFVIELPDQRRFYFAGDTDVFGDMRLIADLYRPEMIMIPIGDLYTMSPKQAALCCQMMRPKTVIGMHYGTFPPLVGTPAQLRELIRDIPGTEVLELEPGKPFNW